MQVSHLHARLCMRLLNLADVGAPLGGREAVVEEGARLHARHLPGRIDYPAHRSMTSCLR